MGKVAICIPCYNSREKLKRLLDSIVIQNFKNYVVIITDDSDNDVIKNLVREYSDIDIRYYRNETRLGGTGNTNQALKYVQGMDVDYIKIMHHDDFFSSDVSLSCMVSVLDNNKDAFFAFSSNYAVGDDVYYERKISDEQIQLLQKDCFNLAYSNIIGAPSTVIIRKNDLLLDERLKWFVDIEWYIQIITKYKQFVFINEPLITIGLSDTQITNECVNSHELILYESIYLYRKYSNLRCEKYMEQIVLQAEKLISRYKIYQMCKEMSYLYIYGAGEKGKECAEFLMKSDIPYKAFIVSDGKRSVKTLYGHNVIELSEYLHVKEKGNVIILALNEKNTEEVMGEVKKTGVQFIAWK